MLLCSRIRDGVHIGDASLSSMHVHDSVVPFEANEFATVVSF